MPRKCTASEATKKLSWSLITNLRATNAERTQVTAKKALTFMDCLLTHVNSWLIADEVLRRPINSRCLNHSTKLPGYFGFWLRARSQWQSKSVGSVLPFATFGCWLDCFLLLPGTTTYSRRRSSRTTTYGWFLRDDVVNQSRAATSTYNVGTLYIMFSKQGILD